MRTKNMWDLIAYIINLSIINHHMITLSTERIEELISGVIFQQMGCKDEKIVVVFDAETELSQKIHQAHRKLTPKAEFIKYNPEDKELRDKLMGLPEGSSVFLIQSVSFRIEDFRIRLSLFHKGIGCLEYSHLAWYEEKNEGDNFLESLEWQGEEFHRLGTAINERMIEDDTLKIYSGKNGEHVLDFGKMEKGFINDGRFYQQKNRGGSVVCGEIFSEAENLRGVNGEISINCYPDERFRILECEPFTITIENGIVTKWTENTPQLFVESIVERIKESETDPEGNHECMVREAGFGLNPKLSLQKQICFVSTFERQAGFHISLGKKHPIYRKKFGKEVVQRYHIDIFSDLFKITTEKEGEETVIYSDGKYQI